MRNALLATFVVVCVAGCGSEAASRPPQEAQEEVPTEAAEVAELGRLLDQLNPAFPEEFFGDRSRWEPYSMSVDEAREAGLTMEEARFEGSWHHATWGLEVHANHTFTLAVRVRHESGGTWSVAAGKLRLEHARFHGRSLSKTVVSEHSLHELERGLHAPTHDKSMEEIRRLHKELMDLAAQDKAK